MTSVAPQICLLAGRPNSGKSSLFNQLSGGSSKVGNYAGCTVDKRSATVDWEGKIIELADLPGIYSLEANGLDEKVALAELENAPPEALILIVMDGNNLREELELALLLRDRGLNIICVVNMLDEVRANKKILDLAGMANLSGLPFFGVSAKTGEGIQALRNYLASTVGARVTEKKRLLGHAAPELEQLFAEAEKNTKAVLTGNLQEPKRLALNQRNDWIDSVVLHRVLGPLIFLTIMFLVFQSVFTWAAPFSDFIDATILAAQAFVPSIISQPLVASFLADGLLAGVGSVLVFVPQIALLFFMIALLELSGYLPRAAYMVDRILKPYGLDGKAFIPLLSSMACAVPGIMAARTMENPRGRLITIMVAPLMTCSARLPVYTLLIATFIPANKIWGFELQGLVMAGMYLLGIIFALLVAVILRFTLASQSGRKIDFLHLPYYRLPGLRELYRYVTERVWHFLKKAGTIIAAMSVLLWVILSFPRDQAFETSAQQRSLEISQQSSLSAEEKAQAEAVIASELASHRIEFSAGGQIGKMLEPLFRPLGFDWQLSLGLLASLAAREVFVSTLGTIFALGQVSEESDSLKDVLLNAKDSAGNPRYTIATCLSLLVFFAFALQCISTIGVARRETNSWRVPAWMFAYTFVMAYGGALAVYTISSWLFV